MRIAFTSTSGQGKTTLVNEIKHHFPTFSTFNSIQRVLTNVIPNFGTSEKGDFFTQTAINGVMVYNLHENKDMIADRTLLCTFAYGKYSLSEEDNNFLISKFENCLKEYDIIFYIPYELEVEDDNFRSKDANYHKKIDEYIRFYINKYKEKYNLNVVTLSGSINERLAIIDKTLKEFNTKKGKK